MKVCIHIQIIKTGKQLLNEDSRILHDVGNSVI